MALTKRYVSVAGGGTNDGTSEANAMTWAQMITDINTPRVGYKYCVKSGTYANGTTTSTLTGDGTATSPNVIEGYNTTEGDLLANGRDSNGALVTTNFPAISYTGTTAKLAINTANFLILRNLSITSAASDSTISLGTSSELSRCVITNTGTNAASKALNAASATISTIEDCDLSTSSTGSTECVNFTNTTDMMMIGCRIKCAPGVGVKAASRVVMVRCTIYECVTGVSATATNATTILLGNTIVNCTGDGVDIVTGTTNVVIIKGNHITGCGGYGIDFNTSTCIKKLSFNRFRDNASGNVNGGGDWEEGMSFFNITSDDSDATDFTNQGSDDYSLLTTAAAITAGYGYRNPIGAHGAGSFGGGSSGEPSYAFIG